MTFRTMWLKKADEITHDDHPRLFKGSRITVDDKGPEISVADSLCGLGRYSPNTYKTRSALIATRSCPSMLEKPVSDQAFGIYKRFFAYDKTDLKPQVESVAESSEPWRKEKITFNAAYGSERIPAYLFLPKDTQPPYQTIIYYPHSGSLERRSSANIGMRDLDFIIKSGRALMFPIYKGTYERHVENTEGTNVWRDLAIQIAKDFMSSVDYLESRNDIDHNRVGYYGISWGGSAGARILA